jgi:hypothetical protein
MTNISKKFSVQQPGKYRYDFDTAVDCKLRRLQLVSGSDELRLVTVFIGVEWIFANWGYPGIKMDPEWRAGHKLSVSVEVLQAPLEFKIEIVTE